MALHQYTMVVVGAVATAAAVRWWWVMRSEVMGREREKGGARSSVTETAIRALGPLEANDPHLLNLLRERYLQPPFLGPPNLMLDRSGPEAENYNTYRIGFSSWIRTNKHLKTLFSGAPSGFFLEAGALDGEFISNTLYLERDLGWTGLLIEADNTLYSALSDKRRHAWSSHACLAPTPYPQQLVFHGYSANASASVAIRLLVRSTGNLEGVHAPAGGLMGQRHKQVVQCFPLLSFLLAVNTTSLQYVSLDVEGAETDILINLPWEEVDVTVWSIEHWTGTNTFKSLYEPTPASPAASTNNESAEKASSKSTHTSMPNVKTVTKVVYVGPQNPHQEKDPYFIRFMAERGYVLYDHWGGDYTFIKRNSSVCEKHCPPH